MYFCDMAIIFMQRKKYLLRVQLRWVERDLELQQLFVVVWADSGCCDFKIGCPPNEARTYHRDNDPRIPDDPQKIYILHVKMD